MASCMIHDVFKFFNKYLFLFLPSSNFILLLTESRLQGCLCCHSLFISLHHFLFFHLICIKHSLHARSYVNQWKILTMNEIDRNACFYRAYISLELSRGTVWGLYDDVCYAEIVKGRKCDDQDCSVNRVARELHTKVTFMLRLEGVEEMSYEDVPPDLVGYSGA